MLACSSNAPVQSEPCSRGDGRHVYNLRPLGGGTAQRFLHTLSLPSGNGTAAVRRKQPVADGRLRAAAQGHSVAETFPFPIALLVAAMLALGLCGLCLHVRTLERHVGELTTSAGLTQRKIDALRDNLGDVVDIVYERLKAAEGRLKRQLHELMRREIWLLVNDKTGLADFALQSAGGRVVSTNDTVQYETAGSILKFLGLEILSLRGNSNVPSAVIQPEMSPGSCWAFRGSRGVVVLSLLGQVRLSAVSLEHISSSVAATGDITSAPRDFSILGLDSLDANPVLLGRFSYNLRGPPLQFFRLLVKPMKSYRLVTMHVHSNHGHPQFTCVYRLRVHGLLDSESHHHRQVESRNSGPHEVQHQATHQAPMEFYL